MGTVDSRLIALDAPTGQSCLGFGADGEVRIDPGMDLQWPGEFQIASPPLWQKASSSSVRQSATIVAPTRPRAVYAPSMRAAASRSGAFDPVVRGAEDFPEDWPRGVAARTGHANVWAPMSADEARGLFFLPTSSPSPDFFGGLRSGDNRYSNSVVALEAGRRGMFTGISRRCITMSGTTICRRNPASSR